MFSKYVTMTKLYETENCKDDCMKYIILYVCNNVY